MELMHAKSRILVKHKVGFSVIYLERAKLSRFPCANLIVNAKATVRSYLRALLNTFPPLLL